MKIGRIRKPSRRPMLKINVERQNSMNIFKLNGVDINQTNSKKIFMRLITNFHADKVIQPSQVDGCDIPYITEIVEIEAVVSPESQTISEEKDYNVHIISLAAWKFTNENKIHKKQLYLLRTVEQDGGTDKKSLVIRSVNKSHSIENEVLPYSIIKFKARINEARNRTVLLKGQILETNQHPKLVAIAEKLTAPIEVEIDWLGKLTLNRDYGSFEGETKFNRERIKLLIHVNSKRKVFNQIKKLEDIWAVANTWEEEAKDYAVSQLLELKNESWLDEDEPKASVAYFKSAMTLESISIYPRNKIEFWFNDGDLFWGHAIEVSSNFNGKFSHAGIAG